MADRLPSKLPSNARVVRCVLIALIIGFAAYGWMRPEGATLNRYLRQLDGAQKHGGPQYAVMIGDSIAAAAPQQLVCGKPVVRAAFDGARVQELLDRVVPTLRAKPPSAVLLAAGVNDTWRHIPAPRPQRLADFRAAYSALISAAQALTPDVGIVLIPPVGQHGARSAMLFDTDLIREFNLIIERLAADAGLPVLTLAALAGADGFARDGLTLDGVHPSAAGYAIWTAAVDQAWKRVRTCSSHPGTLQMTAEFTDYVREQLCAGGARHAGIIGDSITAAAPLAAVGGKLPVNAGFSGARVGDAVRVILPALTGSQPAALLLAIGVNDSKRQFLEPRAQRLTDFARDYRELVRGARSLTPNVGLLLIGPVAKGMEVGDNFFDPDLILAFNAIIAAVAAEMHAPVFALAGLEGIDGLAQPHVTDDGVHLSDAGYAIWNDVVARAWQKLLPAADVKSPVSLSRCR